MDEYAIVLDIVTEIVEEEPPLLFDLTALQIEANKQFGFTAEETLNCAQELYEDGELTYPRTSSHYITPDMELSVSALASGGEGTADSSAASSGTEGTMGGSSSGTGNEPNEAKNYKPDAEAPAFYKRELGDKEFISSVSAVAEADEFENQSSELTESSAESENFENVRIHNSEQTASGAELTSEQKTVNEYFRGDQYSEKDSYENSIDKSRIADFINSNASTTCKLNSNLDGTLDSNENVSRKMSDAQKVDVKELQEMRKTVPQITEETVMQKVISKEQYKEYVRSDDPKIQVSGCAAKATDVAPYTNNIKQAYETLRLDYKGTPYKELVDNKGDMYVMRFTSNYCPSNSNYPKMDGTESWNKPPCTSTGYTGSRNHLVPEYTYGLGQDISDGAIYKVDYKGKETLVGIWNHGRFEKVE